jgi:hypothetical protein
VSLRDLLVLYGIVGLACAVAVMRRGHATGARAAASLAATLLVWPLWAPFALGSVSMRVSRSAPRDGTPEHHGVRRIEAALDAAVHAVASTPMSEVFSPKIASRIAAEVSRVAERLDELTALTTRAGFDTQASARHLADLEARRAPERTVVTARMQHESLARLEAIRVADAQALEELAELLEALRAQLLLARYSGSSAEGAGAIVTEVWARLESLGVAFDMGPLEVDPLPTPR